MTTLNEGSIPIRAAIRAIPPYRQGAAPKEGGFKLSSNENPFPMLPEVRERLVAALNPGRYGAAAVSEVRERLATRFGVEPAAVHVGAGSVSILYQLVHALCEAGDEYLTSWPSFEAYPLLGLSSGATHVRAQGGPSGEHDLEAILGSITPRTRAIILCSPNNPTGPALNAAAVRSFLQRVPANVPVLLDEAYREFVTSPEAVRGEELLADFPDLVLLRTFSKAYGLADLRIGYAVGPVPLMDAARSVGIPLSVSGLAQEAALASLDMESAILERVTELCERRDMLRQGLLDLGFSVPEAQGNFVWLPVGEQAEALGAKFLNAGAQMRVFAGEGVRISVGEAASIPLILEVGAKFLAELPHAGGE